MGDEEGDEPITNREYPGGRVGLGARVIKVYLIMIVIQILKNYRVIKVYLNIIMMVIYRSNMIEISIPI